jgi:peptidoglycan hydrolase-like protein with peptidoglycan-binding domain
MQPAPIQRRDAAAAEIASQSAEQAAPVADPQAAAPEEAPGLSAEEAAKRLAMRQMSGGFNAAALIAKLQELPQHLAHEAGLDRPGVQAPPAVQAGLQQLEGFVRNLAHAMGVEIPRNATGVDVPGHATGLEVPGNATGVDIPARQAGTPPPASQAGSAPPGASPASQTTPAGPSQASQTAPAKQSGAATGNRAPDTALDEIRTGGAYLKRGSYGEDVRALQKALNAAGIQPPLEEDGAYGPAVDAAVRKFQAEHGCQVDGIVGPETMGALDRARGFEPNPAASDASLRRRTPSVLGGGGAGGAGGIDGPSGGGSIPAGTNVDRIIDYTARVESGGKYDAWNADDNGHGVSFGLIQFNQEVGGLPSLLQSMHAANPAKFNEIMGPHASTMLSTGGVRGANLNDPDIKSRMLRLGREPEFQQVQRDKAREGYWNPAARLGASFGIRSERGLAMLFDSCVQNGSGGTERFLRQAAAGGGSEREILARFASLADRGHAGRRTRILNDRGLSDAPFDPGAPAARPSGGAGGASGAGGPSGPSGAGGASGAAGGQLLDRPIGPGTKVLMIGDSHTAGAFGTEFDRLLRSTGASVETYASSGSSPSWWMNGTTTRSGFVARHADGRVEQPHWQDPHATPKLADLIREQRPDVLVVNLGANMRGLSPEGVRQQVRMLAEVAKENGTKLVWTGPPDRPQDVQNSAEIDRFNAILRDAVAPYGGFVGGSQYTSEYAGGDGLHYGGAKGTRIAREWANGVFGEIQRRSGAAAPRA